MQFNKKKIKKDILLSLTPSQTGTAYPWHFRIGPRETKTPVFSATPETTLRKALLYSIYKTWHASIMSSSTQTGPAIIACGSVYSPCLFGKGIVVHARQTCEQQTLHLLKQNLSETITPIDNSCMLSFNPAINPVVCWYYFFMLVLTIV